MLDKNNEFYPKGFHAQVVGDWQKAKAEVERQEPLAAEEIKVLTEKVMRLHSHVQG